MGFYHGGHPPDIHARRQARKGPVPEGKGAERAEGRGQQGGQGRPDGPGGVAVGSGREPRRAGGAGAPPQPEKDRAPEPRGHAQADARAGRGEQGGEAALQRRLGGQRQLDQGVGHDQQGPRGRKPQGQPGKLPGAGETEGRMAAPPDEEGQRRHERQGGGRVGRDAEQAGAAVPEGQERVGLHDGPCSPRPRCAQVGWPLFGLSGLPKAPREARATAESAEIAAPTKKPAVRP